MVIVQEGNTKIIFPDISMKQLIEKQKAKKYREKYIKKPGIKKKLKEYAKKYMQNEESKRKKKEYNRKYCLKRKK